jgi:hypothetical protein
MTLVNIKIMQFTIYKYVLMDEMRHDTATLYPIVASSGDAGEGWRTSVGPFV